MLPVPASNHVANRPSRPAVTVSRSIRIFGVWFQISRRAV